MRKGVSTPRTFLTGDACALWAKVELQKGNLAMLALAAEMAKSFYYMAYGDPRQSNAEFRHSMHTQAREMMRKIERLTAL